MPRNTSVGQPALGNEPRTTNRQHAEVEGLEVRSRELGTLAELDLATLDPNFSYRFVYKSPLKVARAKARGYAIVDPDLEEIKNAVGDAPEVVDGTYSVGDTILMKIPKTQFRARRKASKRKTDKRLAAPKRKFRRTAEEKSSIRGGDPIEVITTKDPEKED